MRDRYAGIIENDIVDSIDGVSVSFWVQGCPHRCPGCHNKIAWDFDSGLSLPSNINDIIIDKLTLNGFSRNFSILGGEPLCNENIELVKSLIMYVKNLSPKSKIIVWTGYTLDELVSRKNDPNTEYILETVDYLIDGRYDETRRDTVHLSLRGSSNQRVLKRIEPSVIDKVVGKKYKYEDVSDEMDDKLSPIFSQ